MFTLYENDKFVLSYENKNYPSGFTHLLTFNNLSTGKCTSMWVDPTGTDTDFNFLEKILKLKNLKAQLPPNEYATQVAFFIEKLIQNSGYTSLEIASLAKDILKHHTNLDQLHNTLHSLDLSHIRNEDNGIVGNIEKMKEDIAGFIKTINDFILNLLGVQKFSTSNTSTLFGTSALAGEDFEKMELEVISASFN